MSRPLVMGIVNVTPDSFSDGGRWASVEAAADHALRLVEQGADVLDIGGESTRPGADPVGEAEEIDRTAPVIERIRGRWDGRISIDTMKPRVARAAVRAGPGCGTTCPRSAMRRTAWESRPISAARSC